MSRLSLFLTTFVVFALIGCDTDSDSNSDASNFDRAKLLDHYAENIILSNISLLRSKTDELRMSVQILVNNPNTASALEKAQDSWKEVAIAYAKTHSFNFGPGETTFGTYAENVATFPVDTTKIRSFISSSDTTLNNFDRDTRGIYGLDFLLFQSNVETDIKDPKYRAYLKAVALNLSYQVDDYEFNWENYISAFKADAGTGSSSSITQMYNAWLIGYELIKNYMVGIPAGTRIGQSAPAPEQVAGLYSKFSREILYHHLKHIEVMYYGDKLSELGLSDEIGFDDYLETTVGGADVLTQTNRQWETVLQACAALPEKPLEEAVISHLPDVEGLYTELSKQTRFFKSELSSRLGLTITYDSGDGD